MAMPPRIWTFNEADRQAYAERYWRFPTRLVTAGVLAKIWRASGTVPSLLPLLGLHAWPTQLGAEAGWTGWTYLSRRRLATLAGLNKSSVGLAFQQLVEWQGMELDRRPRSKYEGGHKTYYRLSATFYPREGEPYAVFPGLLAYNGSWSLLPTAAVRHLYLVLSALDPIRDEMGYLRRVNADLGGNWDRYADEDDWAISDPTAREVAIQAKMLARHRASHPLSLRDLVTYSGLQRGTVIEALRVLLTPIFGHEIDAQTGQRVPTIALVTRGEVQPGRPAWYAVDRRAWDCSWSCDMLNAPTRLCKQREYLWPHIANR
jgi:hypothetical protein